MIPEKGACLLMGKSENIKIHLSLVGHVLLLDSRRTWLIEPSISNLFLSSGYLGSLFCSTLGSLLVQAFIKATKSFLS